MNPLLGQPATTVESPIQETPGPASLPVTSPPLQKAPVERLPGQPAYLQPLPLFFNAKSLQPLLFAGMSSLQPLLPAQFQPGKSGSWRLLAPAKRRQLWPFSDIFQARKWPQNGQKMASTSSACGKPGLEQLELVKEDGASAPAMHNASLATSCRRACRGQFTPSNACLISWAVEAWWGVLHPAGVFRCRATTVSATIATDSAIATTVVGTIATNSAVLTAATLACKPVVTAFETCPCCQHMETLDDGQPQSESLAMNKGNKNWMYKCTWHLKVPSKMLMKKTLFPFPCPHFCHIPVYKF